MSFTSQPRKYDLGEIAYFPWSWNALNSSPITNESGTWIPASVANPTLATRMTASQRMYIHTLQNPNSPQVGLGIPIASTAFNVNTANLLTCNIASTFDNGTPPKIGSRVILNFLHQARTSDVTNTGASTTAVLTGENIYYSVPGTFFQAFAGFFPNTNNAFYSLLITTNPAGTGFCSFSYNYSTQSFTIQTSSDGITWTPQTPSSFFNSTYGMGELQSTTTRLCHARYTNGVRCGMGYHVNAPSTTDNSIGSGNGLGGFPVVYVNCGARILCLIPKDVSQTNTTPGNVSAWLSSDGFTFGGDVVNNVLGTASGVLPSVRDFFFHRNNNACFLIYSSYTRFTTDGGVTWNNPPAPPGTVTHIQTNTTNRASLLAINANTTSLFVSTDTGANWASRTLPVASSNTTSAISYAGNNIVYVAPNGTAWVSTNNGANWSQLTNATLGVLQNPINIVHDGFRFYMLYQGGVGALSTSTNGTTWTARTIPATSLGDINTFFNDYNRANQASNGNLTFAAATNSSDVVITTQPSGNNPGQPGTPRCILSNDGGVTWYVASNIAAASYSIAPLNSLFFQDLIAVDVTGSTSATRGLITGNTFIPEQHIDNLGQRFVASTSSIVNTTLTGQIAFVKIG
jgi:hypothetical protein